MKLLSIIGWLLLSCLANAAANPTRDAVRMGSHGMVLFGGKDALFASHLPMFHAPHDAQVVLQIGLVDAKLDQKLRGTLQAERTLWTINPEAFDLSALWQSQPRMTFQAQLVRGHFERGGKVVFANVQIRVERVLFHQLLRPKTVKLKTARYQMVQQGSSAFVFKRIEQRPDFDHIVRIDLLAQDVHQQLPIAPLELSIDGVKQPSNSVLQQMLDQAGVHAKIAETIYFDTADLR